MNGGFQTDPREAQILLDAVRHDFLYPLSIGLWLDSMCLGVLLLLVSHWTWTAARNDNKRIRGLVGYLILVAVIATALMLVQVFKYLVVGFGRYGALTDITFFRLFPALNAISRVPATAFFAVRAWKLHEKRIWVPLVLAPTLLACLAGGIVATVLMDPTPGNLESSSKTLLITPASEVVADIITTAALYAGLRKRKTGWERTDQLLRRVMVMTIETQLPPLIVAIAFLITCVTSDRGLTAAYFVFYPKIHAICLLLVLVMRSSLIGTQAGSGVEVSGRLVKVPMRQHVPADADMRASIEGENHASTVDLVDKGPFASREPVSNRASIQ